MRWIAIAGRKYSMEWLEENFQQGQEILRAAHEAGVKPRCLCQRDGVPLYVGRQSRFYIAKMPESGHLHAPACPSYEAPPQLSGKRCYTDKALTEGDGVTRLRPAFTLSGRYIVEGPKGDAPAAPDARKVHRVGLKGLLHLLWEEARINTWHPAMEGKRNWGVIRHHLLQAAEQIEVSGEAISGSLFIPETFRKDGREDQLSQQKTVFAQYQGQDDKRYFLLVGQVKAIAQSKFDERLTVSHMPETPLWMPKEVGEKKKFFQHELSVLDSAGDERLICAAVVDVTQKGSLAVRDIAFMAVTKDWIPYFTSYDRKVAADLSVQKRSYTKPLRYEADEEHPLPAFILLDTGANPTHLEIITAFRSKRSQQTKMASIAERQIAGTPVWVWDIARTGTGNLPALPEKQMEKEQ